MSPCVKIHLYNSIWIRQASAFKFICRN